MMLEVLNILDGIDLASLGHKRDALHPCRGGSDQAGRGGPGGLLGDPLFVDVPVQTLLSAAHAADRRKQIRDDRAWPRCRLRLASPEPDGRRLWTPGPVTARGRSRRRQTCPPTPPISAWSTATATRSPPPPATATAAAPWCPEPVSRPRGGARADGPTPRILLRGAGKAPAHDQWPGLAVRGSQWLMPFGTPGSDNQLQAHDTSLPQCGSVRDGPQAAVEAPRFNTHSFPQDPRSRSAPRLRASEPAPGRPDRTRRRARRSPIWVTA